MFLKKDIDRISNYLQKLSKGELIDLILEFSSDSFKREILLKDVSVEKSNICLENIYNGIKIDMNDQELLHDPISFQDNISSYMRELKIFVNKNVDRVFEIVFELIDDIEAKQDEGYLFLDRYYDEEYFDFDLLSSEVLALIEKIDDERKHSEILAKFIEKDKTFEYMGIDYSSIKVKNRMFLKEFFDNSSNFDFYLLVKDALTFEEKEKFLLAYSSDTSYSELVDLYVQNSKKDLAVNYLENLLSRKFNIDYVNKLLTLKDISKESLREFVLKAIKLNQYKNLDFIIDNIPKVDNQEDLEKVLKTSNISFYYKYLEKYRRLSEMFEILDELPFYKWNFFKQYKKEFKKDAIEFFKSFIQKKLEFANKEAYYDIAECLIDLKDLISKEEFDVMLADLKKNYKRRRNFITILNERF